MVDRVSIIGGQGSGRPGADAGACPAEGCVCGPRRGSPRIVFRLGYSFLNRA